MFYLLLLSFSFLSLQATKKIPEGYYAFVPKKQTDEAPVAALKKGLSCLKKIELLHTKRAYSGYHTIKRNGIKETLILRAPLLFHALLLSNKVSEKEKIIRFLSRLHDADLTQKLTLFHNGKGSLTTPLFFAIEFKTEEKLLSVLARIIPLKKRLKAFLLALSLEKYTVAQTIYRLDPDYHHFYKTNVTHFLLNYSGENLIEIAYELLIKKMLPYNPEHADTNDYDLLTRLLLCKRDKEDLTIDTKQEELFEYLKSSFDVRQKKIKLSDSNEERNLLDIASSRHCSLPIIASLSWSGLTLTPERLSNSEIIE